MERTSNTEATPRVRFLTNETCQRVLEMAAELFAGIRFFFSKFVRSKLHAFLLTPLSVIVRVSSRPLGPIKSLTPQSTRHHELPRTLSRFADSLTRTQVEEYFALGLEALKRRAEDLSVQLVKLEAQRKRFQDVRDRFRSFNTI